jgi:hypothetical protein
MVDAMVEDHEIKRPMTKRLSRWVYRLLVFVAAWFALAVWSFAGPAVTDYLLFVVSGLIFVAVALVLILSSVKRDNAEASRREGQQENLQPPVFRDLAGWDLDIFQTGLSVNEAALQILLPAGDGRVRDDCDRHCLAYRGVSGAAVLSRKAASEL